MTVASQTDEISIYPLKNPGNDRLGDPFDVRFAMACFPEGEGCEYFQMVVFTEEKSKKYYRRIIEMGHFNLEKGSVVADIDGWVGATKKANKEGTPIFALSFGVFHSDSTPGIYLHVRNGISPEEAFYYLNKHAQEQLFGSPLNF